MNGLILAIGQIGVVALLGGLYAILSSKEVRLTWFLGALILFILYSFLLTRGFFALPNFPESADWNWLGKTLSLGGMLVAASLPIFGFRKAGLTFRQNQGSWPAFLVFYALSALIFYFAVKGADGRDDWETIAFQWTMPGLDEEVFYRGVLLVAMNEAFTRRISIAGAPIGFGGVLTSILFGLVHALSYGEAGYAFDATAFLMTGAPSLLLLWIREKTGSLLLPIIAHNVANGAFTLF